MVNYLKQIDELIEHPFNDDSISYLNRLSDLIQDLEQIEQKKNYNEFLFNKENDISTQKFIAFSFIRIMKNSNLNHVKNSIHQIFKLIQTALPDIFNMIGISDKTETYQKEKLLINYIQEREEEFNDQLVYKGEISDLNKFQLRFRKVIASKKNFVLQFFVGSLLTKSTLDSIFNRIADYIESNEELKYQKYLILKEVLDEYIEEAKNIGTKYANDYFFESFVAINNIVTKDVEGSPYYLPSKLEIFRTEKKYPLAKGIKNSVNVGIQKRGKGYAQNVILKIIDFDKNSFSFLNSEQLIGDLKIESTIVEFEYEVKKESDYIKLELELSWNSTNGQSDSIRETLELQSQSKNIDWERIKSLEPYNLEPVETDTELIGRESILQRLKSKLILPIGSSYIFGQRRVGKTSIVKTLLNSNSDTNLLIYYIEGGDWNNANNALNSMNNLGEKICKKIKRFNPKFNSIQVPLFEGSFNKISDFLDEVIDIDPKFKLLLILDEFDRISSSLYERGDVGKSFVLTLRAISNRPQFGFILVGGEKLEYILSQWQEFNKFTPIRVDYFSKERDWEDFKKLIKKPVEGILEISDNAINAIYEETAGNPYFTKKICMELFSSMVNNRDTHVTNKEVRTATCHARNSANIGATDFSHFWEDGIKGKVEKEEEISVKRRKILICITHLLSTDTPLKKENIFDYALEFGLKNSEVDKYLNEFEQRKIIFISNNVYCFVVNFFKEWLVSGGIQKIIATFEEEERVSLNQQMEEKAKIKTEEISLIQTRLKIYKGVEITTEKIREWLEQFDDIFDQRLIFKILENFKLYTEIEIRSKLVTMFTFVQSEFKKRGAIRIIETQKKKRNDILVSFLDKSPAKGASYFTKLFADENNIYVENVCFPELIEKTISEKSTIKSLLLIDDFIGSGNTILENAKQFFNASLCKILKEKDIFVIFGVLTGFSGSKELIEQKLSSLDIDFTILIVDILNEEDKCFSNSSSIFSNSVEKNRAKAICIQKGELLVPKFPLGYSDSEALIAFPMNCPNNTLPIFWKRTETWKPIFERN